MKNGKRGGLPVSVGTTEWPPGPFRRSPFLLSRQRVSERPAAVKRAPWARAQRSLDGEDRSGRIAAGRNGPFPCERHPMSFFLGGKKDEQQTSL